MKRKVSLMIIVALLISAFCSTAAFAVIESNPCIEFVDVEAYAEGNQVLRFDLQVDGNSPMVEIGASRLEVYESDGTYVRTYYATNPMYEEFMMSTSAFEHYGYIRFRGDVGVSYYAIAYFTATNEDGVTGTESYRSNTVTCVA